MVLLRRIAGSKEFISYKGITNPVNEGVLAAISPGGNS